MRGLFAQYIDAWGVTNRPGRLMLAGCLALVVRGTIFSVAFPLFEKSRGSSPGEIGVLISIYAFTLFIFGIPITVFGSRGFTKHLLTVGPLIAAAGLLLLIFGRNPLR
jgi:predicted MFS family arabinose efflux permease